MGFRLVSTDLWTDHRGRELPVAVRLSARAVLAWLMSGPARTTLPGLIAIGPAGIAEALRVPTVEPELAELERVGLIEIDRDGPLVRVVDAVAWDGKPNGRVIKAWPKLLSDLPKSPLVARHLPQLRASANASCNVETVTEVFASISDILDSRPHTVRDREPDTLADRASRSRSGSSAPSSSSSSSSSSSAAAAAPGADQPARSGGDPDDGIVRSPTRIPCPIDLDRQIDAGAFSNLEMAKGIPEAAARSVIQRFALRYSATPDDRRTLRQWVSGAMRAATEDGRAEALRLAEAAENEPEAMAAKAAAREAEIERLRARDIAKKDRERAEMASARTDTPVDLDEIERQLFRAGGAA